MLVPPGAIVPVLNDPPSAVAVWAMLSTLYQATFWPTLTVAGFGEYELLPFVATIAIVTSAATEPGLDGGVTTGSGLDEGAAGV